LTKTGEINLTNANLKEIPLYFSNTINESDIKYLNVLIVDGLDNPISQAKVIFFRDGNKAFERTTNALGKTTDFKLNIALDNSNYKAVIFDWGGFLIDNLADMH